MNREARPRPAQFHPPSRQNRPVVVYAVGFDALGGKWFGTGGGGVSLLY